MSRELRMFLWLVGILLVMLAVVEWRRFHPDVAPAVVQTDKAKVDTIVTWQTRVDTITQRVNVYLDSTRKKAAAGQAAAAKLDSEAVAVVDSNPFRAYVLERQRGDSLLDVNHSLMTALDTATRDRDRWKFLADSSISLNKKILGDLTVASQPCRIFFGHGPLCPSRKTAVVVGLVSGLVTHQIWSHH